MDTERLSGALQENVLTLLVFKDEHVPVIRSMVPVEAFDSRFYRDIATKAYGYFDQFGEAIGEHIADELEDELKGDDARKADMYSRLLDRLFNTQEQVNAKYILSKLREFVRQQALKGSIMEASKLLLDGDLSAAEAVLEDGMRKRVEAFDPGLNLMDPAQALRFFDDTEEVFPTGIKTLDRMGIGPGRGQLFLFIAPPKRGKSWLLTSIGVHAMRRRLRVLHVTLEMSENLVAKRYMQALFSYMSKPDAAGVRYQRFDRTTDAQLALQTVVVDRPHLKSPDARAELASKVAKLRVPIRVKGFPMGSLSLEQLRTFMLMLERTENFVPDIVLLDYIDLMKINPARLREETSAVTKDFRGLMTEFNCAGVSATQGNRASSKSRLVDEHHVMEDWSKIATADTVVTFSRTDAEKEIGLARLTVTNARTEEDRFSVLISQAYKMGQFSMDSILLPKEYWDNLNSYEDNG